MQPVTLAEGLHVPATGETLSAREVTTKHHALLVVEAPPATTARRRPLRLRSYLVGLISVHESFRREDLYGDDGC